MNKHLFLASLACMILGGTQASGQSQPLFHLSAPANGSPAQPVSGVVLWWTAAPNVAGYSIQIATDSSFKTMVLEDKVKAGITSFAIPDDTLEKGAKYSWRVLADCGTGTPTCPAGTQIQGTGSPFSFSTAFNIFERIENAGFTLQRAIAGDDATEGAQFSFLASANATTVYTADFALIWDHFLAKGLRTAATFQAAWEGNLTSDESESEDALKYHVNALVLYDFRVRKDKTLDLQRTFDVMRWATGLKYETSQDATTKKVMWENVLTPTSRKLGIGVALPNADPKHAVQFWWRPYLGLDVGHTSKPGASAEIKSTILRITPRARATLRFNGLARALNVASATLYADSTFVTQPIEDDHTHNFFVSGFEIKVADNIGVGFTYKNGEAAPKFTHIETFAGMLTISFGK